MGKRSTFARRKNDAYMTWDPRAGAALSPHLGPMTRFAEPCAGDGSLTEQLVALGHICLSQTDIKPASPSVSRLNALKITGTTADVFITNPPWTRDILHRLIVHLSAIKPTWMLFDADWAHTLQSIPYMPLCRRIVSVGRLRWIKGTDCDSKDNCAWYLFAPQGSGSANGPNTVFFPRASGAATEMSITTDAEAAA